MSLNLITFIFFYFMIIISTVGYGYFFVNITRIKVDNFNYGYLGLFGIFILTFYSYISHFFIPHNYISNIALISGGLISFVFFFYKNKKNNFFLLSNLFFFILFIAFLVFKAHDDFPYYHFPYTYYLTQSKILIGIGHFNHGFRTPSSIFYLNSLFYLPVAKYYFFQIGQVMIMGFTSLIFLDFINKSIKKKNYNIIFFLSLLSFTFINIFFYRIGEHGTDRSAQILIFLLIIQLLIIINFNENFKENISKILVLLLLIVSLKAFYILYLLLLIPIIFYLIKKKDLNYFYEILKNPLLYFSTIFFVIILSVNFFNSGCLIYPVKITCIDGLSWATPLKEVSAMNDWYEQWSKAGAGPNFRVSNPEIYIQGLNWVGNWFSKYFFNKVSDFLYGLIFLCIIYLALYNSKKTTLNKNYEGVLFIYIILLILFIEWFYNHPALRYGGYPLISSLFFLPLASYLSKKDYQQSKIKIKSYFIICLTVLIFFSRNINRLHAENNQYGYNPLKIINYEIDNKYFYIQDQFDDIIEKNRQCIKDYIFCNKHSVFNVKKINNYIIFLRK